MLKIEPKEYVSSNFIISIGLVRELIYVQIGPGAHVTSYTMGTVSLSRGVKRPGGGVDHPPHIASRLKKE